MRQFLFRLALVLGRTVAELEETLSSRELSEWIAFYAMEPFGEQRADLRSAIIAATVANCHRVSGTAFQPADFMPYETRKKDVRESIDAIRSMIQGGKRHV